MFSTVKSEKMKISVNYPNYLCFMLKWEGGGATEDVPITSGRAEERLPQIIPAIAVPIVVSINSTVTITSIIPLRNLY
jgi:hypothetical protein